MAALPAGNWLELKLSLAHWAARCKRNPQFVSVLTCSCSSCSRLHQGRSLLGRDGVLRIVPARTAPRSEAAQTAWDSA